MVTNIHASNIELTPVLKDYAEKKVESLTKFFPNIIQADIDIGMNSHHHNKGKIFYAEVNLHLEGDLVRVVKEEEDLYKAIDKVKDHLKVELEKRKEKLRGKDKKSIRGQKEYQQE